MQGPVTFIPVMVLQPQSMAVDCLAPGPWQGPPTIISAQPSMWQQFWPRGRNEPVAASSAAASISTPRTLVPIRSQRPTTAAAADGPPPPPRPSTPGPSTLATASEQKHSTLQLSPTRQLMEKIFGRIAELQTLKERLLERQKGAAMVATSIKPAGESPDQKAVDAQLILVDKQIEVKKSLHNGSFLLRSLFVVLLKNRPILKKNEKYGGPITTAKFTRSCSNTAKKEVCHVYRFNVMPTYA
jgi:hypothetical protein